ncbi:hypothetical protein ES705_16563 [subsurface metagenome]
MKKKSTFKGFVKVFGKDKQTLLSEIKIGESLAMGCELEKDEIGLYIASADVSASCGFKFDEWDNFVRGVNEANKNLKEIYK